MWKGNNCELIESLWTKQSINRKVYIYGCFRRRNDLALKGNCIHSERGSDEYEDADECYDSLAEDWKKRVVDESYTGKVYY